MDDYVDVAARIQQFYERYPDGRLTRRGEPSVLDVGGKLFVMYTALAYRAPDDPLPAIGTAWEPFPGPSPFTRDSELMNAETAAWGRAIIAAGIPSKKIASRQEVDARSASPVPEAKAPPPKPIKEARARELLVAAMDVVDATTLQRAVAHLAGSDPGDLAIRDEAVMRMTVLDAPAADRLAAWIKDKAAKAEEAPDAA
jgi:hypothetical protein